MDVLPEVRRYVDRAERAGSWKVPHLRRQAETSGSGFLVAFAARADSLVNLSPPQLRPDRFRSPRKDR